MRGALLIGLIPLFLLAAARADEPGVFRVMPLGEQVLQSGIEGVSVLLLVEGEGTTDAGRLHSDLRGRLRLELAGVVLESRPDGAVSIDPQSGRESALAALPARRLDLHDFLAYALETRPVFDEVEPAGPEGRVWIGRDRDGSTGTLYRDERGRVSGYDAVLTDGSGLEVRILDWTRLADFDVPARVSTVDSRGAREWRLGSHKEEAMAQSGPEIQPRWVGERSLPPEGLAALESERAFSRMARERGMKAAFLEWLEPGGTVFGPGPMPVAERYAKVPDDPGQQPLLQWLPEWIVMAGSRDLAAISGRWELTPVGAAQPTDFGQYLSVWRRDGEQWRVVVDTGTDQPEARPLTPRATGRVIEALAPRPMMIPIASELAARVEGEFQEIAFRDGYLAALRDHADRDVIALRVGVPAALGPEHLTVPDPLAELGPRIEVTGSVASNAHDFLATWGILHFGANEGGPERLAFLRVWQLETARWQIVADAFRELP